jgi:hypothetical protein
MLKARDLIANTEDRLDIAGKIYRDLSGSSRTGLSVKRYGKIVLIDDNNDKWLVNFDDYDDSLEDVIEYILSGREDDDYSYYYNRFYSTCPSLYSRVGPGKYNANLPGLVQYLKNCDLTNDQIEIVFNEIGENLMSALTTDE